MKKLIQLILIGAMSLVTSSVLASDVSSDEDTPAFTLRRQISVLKKGMKPDEAETITQLQRQFKALGQQIAERDPGKWHVTLFPQLKPTDNVFEEVKGFLEQCITKRRNLLDALITPKTTTDEAVPPLASAKLVPDAASEANDTPTTTGTPPAEEQMPTEPAASKATSTTQSTTTKEEPKEAPTAKPAAKPAAVAPAPEPAPTAKPVAKPAAVAPAPEPDFISRGGYKVFTSTDKAKNEDTRLIPNPVKQHENFTIADLKRLGYIPGERDTRPLKDSDIYDLYADTKKGHKSVKEARKLANTLRSFGK
jgi:hypothetical protein